MIQTTAFIYYMKNGLHLCTVGVSSVTSGDCFSRPLSSPPFLPLLLLALLLPTSVLFCLGIILKLYKSVKKFTEEAETSQSNNNIQKEQNSTVSFSGCTARKLCCFLRFLDKDDEDRILSNPPCFSSSQMQISFSMIRNLTFY